MTDQQIESAARKLCELRNWDMGNRLDGYPGLSYAMAEIRTRLQMDEAIRSATAGASNFAAPDA